MTDHEFFTVWFIPMMAVAYALIMAIGIFARVGSVSWRVRDSKRYVKAMTTIVLYADKQANADKPTIRDLKETRDE